SAEAGMHRFTWDLRYPQPDSLAHDYPIAAIYRDTPRHPLGPAVLAGRYTVKLTVGGRTYTQPLVAKMDPRVKTPPTGLTQQFALESGISKGMNEDFVALKQVQLLRAQLKDRRTRAGQAEIAEALSALDKKIEALEGKAETSVFGLAPRGIEGETLSRLNLELGRLLSVVDGADRTPTTQAVAAYGELEQALRELLARWKELQTHDVAALNEQLKKVNLPPITLSPTP